MEEYNRLNDLLMEMYVLRSRGKSVELGPQHLQMFVMACYDTEKFRDFVFKSRFLEKFDLDAELIRAMETDDTKLLEFAFLWLRFALFREPVLSVKSV